MLAGPSSTTFDRRCVLRTIRPFVLVLVLVLNLPNLPKHPPLTEPHADPTHASIKQASFVSPLCSGKPHTLQTCHTATEHSPAASSSRSCDRSSRPTSHPAVRKTGERCIKVSQNPSVDAHPWRSQRLSGDRCKIENTNGAKRPPG